MAEICKAVNYNFFSKSAHQLSVDDPVTEKRLQFKKEEFSDEIEHLNKKIERLKHENETLQIKFDLLESMIEKLGGIKQ